jgi:drug/metabolite transporter (DMT)-like permease
MLTVYNSNGGYVMPTYNSKIKNERLYFIAAFAALYVIWGSTYLAIRVVVASIPPLFAAGIRFVIAGVLLYLWALARGSKAPTRH